GESAVTDSVGIAASAVRTIVASNPPVWGRRPADGFERRNGRQAKRLQPRTLHRTAPAQHLAGRVFLFHSAAAGGGPSSASWSARPRKASICDEAPAPRDKRDDAVERDVYPLRCERGEAACGSSSGATDADGHPDRRAPA